MRDVSVYKWRMVFGAMLALFLAFPSEAMAHGISEESRATMSEGSTVDFIWLGAEHMVTGYDHLLFLFGVIFFLTSFRDIVRFITAFTLGHCITLLGATMMGIAANAYIIDAIIALSVIYKGFENLDGFKKYLNFDAPNLLTMVFVFGLIHGFGLSTRLQELTLGHEGLVSKILAFNVGVELGQILALSLMLGFFAAWRKTPLFARFSTASNLLLIAAGLGLFVMQVDGYMHEGDHHSHHAEEDAAHGTHQHAEEAGTSSAKQAEALDEPAENEAKPSPTDEQHEAGDKEMEAEEPHSHGHSHSHEHKAKPDKPSKKTGGHSHGNSKGHSHGSSGHHTH